MRALLYIFLIAVLAGCSYSGMTERELDRAQQLMQHNPADALETLNGIDVSEMHDSATLARWSLLYTEAMAANRISAPTDTIVNIALRYYAARDPEGCYRRAVNARAAVEAAPPDTLAEARYLQKEREYRLYVERSRRDMIVLTCIIAVLAALSLAGWLRHRLRMREMRIEALVSEASGLRTRLTAATCDASRLQTSLQSLLGGRFALIDNLCDTYYQSQGTRNERKAIADLVKARIDAVRTDPAVTAEMERTVDECRDNLMSRLRTEYRGKPEEYTLAMYLACGLSPRTISLLTGDSIDYVYKRKSRLKSRLRQAAPPHLEQFIEIF